MPLGIFLVFLFQSSWKGSSYLNTLCSPHYSPALKKWGYFGFAMSFRDSVTVIPSFRNSMTAKSKCILLNNFYVCGPTSMKLMLHLVSKVSKM